MKRLKQVDFSGFTREEAIARLEMVQAVLTRSIDTGEQNLEVHRRESEVAGKVTMYEAFRDGSLTAAFSFLDVVQGREIGTSMRERLGPKETPTPTPAVAPAKEQACNEPLFV